MCEHSVKSLIVIGTVKLVIQAKHSLVAPTSSKSPLKPTAQVLKCSNQGEENISMYCVFCRVPVCYVCLERGQHTGHEVKVLSATFKEEKVGDISSIYLPFWQS